MTHCWLICIFGEHEITFLQGGHFHVQATGHFQTVKKLSLAAKEVIVKHYVENSSYHGDDNDNDDDNDDDDDNDNDNDNDDNDDDDDDEDDDKQ